jgi:hypothetical protein
LIFSGIAPWILPEDIEAAKRRDPIGAEFARLWKGKWISGKGGAVGEDSIDRCFKLEGPATKAEFGWEYVAGLDLGVSHDHAGLICLGVNKKKNLIKVAQLRGFEPSIPNDRGVLEVDCQAVEASCLEMHKTFHIQWFGYDPAAGGSFMAQRLRRQHGVLMRETSFSSPVNCRAGFEGWPVALL